MGKIRCKRNTLKRHPINQVKRAATDMVRPAGATAVSFESVPIVWDPRSTVLLRVEFISMIPPTLKLGFFPFVSAVGPTSRKRSAEAVWGGVENQSSNYVSYGMEDFFPEKVLLPATSCDDDGDEDAAAWQ